MFYFFNSLNRLLASTPVLARLTKLLVNYLKTLENRWIPFKLNCSHIWTVLLIRSMKLSRRILLVTSNWRAFNCKLKVIWKKICFCGLTIWILQSSGSNPNWTTNEQLEHRTRSSGRSFGKIPEDQGHPCSYPREHLKGRRSSQTDAEPSRRHKQGHSTS